MVAASPVTRLVPRRLDRAGHLGPDGGAVGRRPRRRRGRRRRGGATRRRSWSACAADVADGHDEDADAVVGARRPRRPRRPGRRRSRGAPCPSGTQPSPSRSGRAPSSAAKATVPVPPAQTAPSSSWRSSASAHSRTSGTNWLVVARNGVGSATRPSSSSAIDELDGGGPDAAVVLGHGEARPVELDEGLPERVCRRRGPPTTARTSDGGHSRSTRSRTTSCSASWSSVELEVHGDPLLSRRWPGSGRGWPAARASRTSGPRRSGRSRAWPARPARGAG